jgi:CysZ protein
MSQALAPLAPPADPLALAPTRPGFLDGTRALFGGFAFLVRTPATWPLALVPVMVAGLVGTLVFALGASLVFPYVAAHLGPKSHLLAALVNVLAGALLAVIAAVVGLGLAQPLSGPALNRIVRRVEGSLGAPAWPQTSALTDVGRALGSILVGYTFGLPLLALLALISLFFPPAAVVTFPLKLVVLALLLAWDLLDYPLSIHGLPLGQRVAFVVRNARALVGFGFGLALLSLIPFAGLLALPAGVAGAARLTRGIERWEERHRG